MTHIIFKLDKLLHLPSISKNLLSVSQFARDNSVFFELHPHFCLVKSQATNKVLLQGVVGADGLYSFHNFKFQDHSPQLLSTSTFASITSPTVNKSSVVASSSINSPPSTVSLWNARLVLKLVFRLLCFLLHGKISQAVISFIYFCLLSSRTYLYRFMGAISFNYLFWLQILCILH